MQEAGANKPQPLDVATLATHGSLVQYDSLYGLALHLGNHADGHPIVTLTSQRTDLGTNSPSLGYATTIAKGLVEFTKMSHAEAVDYVLATSGVDERLDRSALLAATTD